LCVIQISFCIIYIPVTLCHVSFIFQLHCVILSYIGNSDSVQTCAVDIIVRALFILGGTRRKPRKKPALRHPCCRVRRILGKGHCNIILCGYLLHTRACADTHLSIVQVSERIIIRSRSHSPILLLRRAQRTRSSLLPLTIVVRPKSPPPIALLCVCVHAFERRG
jgi:hypothetical protein